MAELQSEPSVKKATGDPRMTILSTTDEMVSNEVYSILTCPTYPTLQE